MNEGLHSEGKPASLSRLLNTLFTSRYFQKWNKKEITASSLLTALYDHICVSDLFPETDNQGAVTYHQLILLTATKVSFSPRRHVKHAWAGPPPLPLGLENTHMCESP
uniref:Uncharacterized protein n=1 Tax=Trichobilharzia regenti TaxID=157069 RepID=A0AA85J2E9_TRIRE|nr:unnamed protein product [Trichobilharzia regenti]